VSVVTSTYDVAKMEEVHAPDSPTTVFLNDGRDGFRFANDSRQMLGHPSAQALRCPGLCTE